jgi:transposase InsO family protein
VTDELNASGINCGVNRVARLMRENSIRAKQSRKFKVTTNSKHNYPVAPNLLNRQFEIDCPNKVWVSDITYIWTSEGWLYLAGVLDLYSRRIVGWSMSRRITEQLTLDALNQAVTHRQPPKGLLHHSDQGKQYASNNYQKLLKNQRMICSMSRKGDCWDNAVMESFFGTLKTELIYHEKFITREDAKLKIFDYIEMFYNCKRRHSSLGSKSPVEFERTTKPT